MEDSSPLSQPVVQTTPIITQQGNNPSPINQPTELSPKKKIVDLAIGLVATIVVYVIVAQLWRKIAYAVFAPSLEASGEDFPGIIFFAHILVIPIFAIVAIIFWKSRRNLAIGIIAGAVLTSLYFLITCSMTLAPGGCLGLLT